MTIESKANARDAQLFILQFEAFAASANENSRAHGFWENEGNDGEKLMLVVSELAEGLEALRHKNPPSDHIPAYSGIEEELADAIIRIMDLSHQRGWRVAEAVIAKMTFNRSRPPKHGKEF